jgi:hypothetical protein
MLLVHFVTENCSCADATSTVSDLTPMLPDVLPTLASEDASTAASLAPSGSSSFYFLPPEQLAALHAKVLTLPSTSLGIHVMMCFWRCLVNSLEY